MTTRTNRKIADQKAGVIGWTLLAGIAALVTGAAIGFGLWVAT